MSASPGEASFSDLSHLSRPSVFDVEAVCAKLRELSDADLIAFGKEMRGIVFPRTYDGDGKPQVSAFSIQWDLARAEWRARHPK